MRIIQYNFQNYPENYLTNLSRKAIIRKNNSFVIIIYNQLYQIILILKLIGIKEINGNIKDY